MEHIVVAIHDGDFHADEVFAIVVFQMIFGEALVVVKTRDQRIMDAADYRVDVGDRYDPETNDFDHHAPAESGARPNGVPYASFGLVWKHFGQQVCNDAEVAELVDRRLVQGIDALDSGVRLIEKETFPGVSALNVTTMISSFNPTSFEEDRDQNAAFFEAVRWARLVLERTLAQAQAQVRAHENVRRALARADDPRIIVLDRDYPWYKAVITGSAQALYVISPRKDGHWSIEAVRKNAGDFELRRPFPAAWGGKNSHELPALTGVAEAFFCHEKLFKAVALTREGAVALARLALES